jgi:hypothetical protein
MPEIVGPVYEVTHTIDPEIAGDFDDWLGRHIQDMLELPGINAAQTFTAGDDADGRPRRVTHYFFDTDADLEHYLAGPAGEMRRYAEDIFAGRFEVERRTLHETDVVDGTIQPAQSCLNCGTPLSGQYCGQCGQRARSRLISIWELTQEAFGDLLELDSRLWRTLVPLMVKPGKLTRDYLEGRRARFMPPFRTYLVLSIFFFLVAFFDPREELGILFEPEAPAETTDAAEAGMSDATERAANSARDIRQEVMDQLVEDGVITPEQAEGMVPGAGETDADSGGVNITFNENRLTAESDCDDLDSEEIPEWARSRLTPERLKIVCERVNADDGRAFVGKLLDNVPAALIILLPLMALLLKILYPLSKRYYVEHLLFVVHFHAFIFLILTLQILFGRLTSLLSLSEAFAAITGFAVAVYIFVYFYKAMRRVYEQGHFFTMTKFLVLFTGYTAGLSVIFLLAALFAAFSI